jgi:D-alanyl-D-alanine carboxypeptidase
MKPVTAFYGKDNMKAYNIKCGTKVIVTDENVKTPPSSIPVNKGDEIIIDKIDGMYVNGINKDGDRIYFAAWTEVEPCC